MLPSNSMPVNSLSLRSGAFTGAPGGLGLAPAALLRVQLVHAQALRHFELAPVGDVLARDEDRLLARDAPPLPFERAVAAVLAAQRELDEAVRAGIDELAHRRAVRVVHQSGELAAGALVHAIAERPLPGRVDDRQPAIGRDGRHP